MKLRYNNYPTFGFDDVCLCNEAKCPDFVRGTLSVFIPIEDILLREISKIAQACFGGADFIPMIITGYDGKLKLQDISLGNESGGDLLVKFELDLTVADMKDIINNFKPKPEGIIEIDEPDSKYLKKSKAREDLCG